MTKKLVSLLLILTLALGMTLSGCGSQEPKETLPSLILSGGMVLSQEPAKGEELTPEEAAQIEQSMRDYVGHEYDHVPDSYPVNNASSFFFSEHLSGDSSALYDAILLAAQDPYAGQNHVKALVRRPPQSDDFMDQFQLASEAVQYDHPELFWIFRNQNVGLRYSYMPNQPGPDYEVYVYIEGVSSEVEQQIIAFNQNTRKFLALVDTAASQEDMALQIHDLLVHNVEYDDDCLARISDPSNFPNKAFSAYGAMVMNTAGQPFTAVCAGYSLAYLYLLQQVGIEATVVLGFVGSSSDANGSHCWNLIRLGGQWHEVDVTWDDVSSQLNEVEPQYLSYYQEALADPAFYDLTTHAMYCISTDKICNFIPDPSLTYYTRDGRMSFSFFGSSSRHRAVQSNDFPAWGALMELVPIAN